MPRLVLISDTHELHEGFRDLPPGDILVHAGDITIDGSLQWIQNFGQWLNRQNGYGHIICIAGNHDFAFKLNPAKARRALQEACPRVIYLENTDIEVMGLKFYGSPYTPYFDGFPTGAFTRMRGEMHEEWDKIPRGLDVLVTHGPPAGDLGGRLPRGEDIGDGELRNAILEKKPRLHVCGHVHEGYGKKVFQNTIFVNAAVTRIGHQGYYPSRDPIVVDLELQAKGM